MGATPEELKAEIERTRGELSADVDALTDRVSPAAIARRRTDAVRGAATSVKHSVMGQASQGASTASDAAGAVRGAPSMLGDKAQGNPMAAGLIAFGAGLLVSTLLPTTQAEAQASADLTDRVQEPVKNAAQGVAQQLKDDLQPAATEAVQQVKETAQGAAQTTVAHAKEAGADVAGGAKETAAQTREDISS